MTLETSPLVETSPASGVRTGSCTTVERRLAALLARPDEAVRELLAALVARAATTTAALDRAALCTGRGTDLAIRLRRLRDRTARRHALLQRVQAPEAARPRACAPRRDRGGG